MISMNLGKPLAVGRTAELYAWEGGYVLKLFFDWFELEDIHFEQKMARAIHSSGLPVPAAGEILQVNGHNGLVYERFDGVNMWEVLEKQPWRVFNFARRTAKLHVEMHSNTLRPDIPSQRRRLEKKLQGAEVLPDLEKQTFLAALSGLPDGNSICHGDFHPGNILLASSRAVIIDWIDASLGNHLADVARTTIILLGAAASSQIPSHSLKVLIRLFHSIYLLTYFGLLPGGIYEYRRWLPIVAAARLSENIPEVQPWLLDQSEKAIKR
jgi:Ser/Thr protein kinase RdoA (MazF antagonist)